MVQVMTQPEQVRHFTRERARSGETVGVVPTMGALHQGHLALVREAKRRADAVVVTVFVNPTQFGPGEDFDKYPRNLERDTELAAEAGAALVFAPEADVMYPRGEQTRVQVGGLSSTLCGRCRPDHFEGVATIVAKLFNVFGEGIYVFGRKDYQQLRIIERMAEDLLFPVQVVGHPLVRDDDGLALSSRNQYLSDDARRRALSIPRSLQAANAAYLAGERQVGRLREMVRGALTRSGVAIDYAALADVDSLREHEDVEQLGGRTLLAIAGRVGGTRLIDNMVLGEDEPPIVEPQA